MQDARREKIGEVTLDYTHYPGRDLYCDGAVEQELLAIAQNVPPERYNHVIREKKSWEVLYHFSDLRENIVSWLPFEKGMKVLEVGSGCGAITGSLARLAGSVTCVDLSGMRSRINACRHRDCANVTIHVGNFQDIEPDLPADYDYVFLIGVFEYGQSYIGTGTPFQDFYRIVKRHVKPGGRVVIAIENKMGLKYWAGCREDHLGTFFSGLEDYPDGGAARTFTRGGLERILKDCGEEAYHFYYPYPDYKFTTMIYSDRYLPKVGDLTNNLRNFDRDRMLLFDEKRVFDMLIREKLFPLYSNSFLVVTGSEPETIYSRFSNDRARRFQIRTDIGQRGDGTRYVRKYPASAEAAGHIRAISQNGSLLSRRYGGHALCVNRLEEKRDENGLPYVELEYLNDAVTLEELLDDCLQKEDAPRFDALLKRYFAILADQSGDRTVTVQDQDLIFSNLCIQGDVWTVIDYEWTDAKIDAMQVARRAFYCYVLENPRRKESPILQEALKRLKMDDAAFAKCAKKEQAFQRMVMREEDGQLRIAVTDMRHRIGHLALPFQEAFAHIRGKRIEIFEDYGEGYSPQHSYWIHNAYVAENLFRAILPFEEKVRRIRLDPAEQPCLLQIRRIRIGDCELNRQQIANAVFTNGTTLQGSGADCVFFDTSDPNIEVRLDALQKEKDKAPGVLTVEAYLLRLTDEMRQGLRALMTGRKHSWFRK